MAESGFISGLTEFWGGMLASPWIALLFMLVVLTLLYRQQILSFGTRYGGWWGVLLFSIVATPLLMLEWHTVSSLLLGVALLALISEIQVANVGKQRRPTYMLNLGILFSLLTKIHPAFIWILPAGLLQMRQQRRLSWSYFSALLFGLLSLWWIEALFFAPPEVEGFLNYLERGVAPLWHESQPAIDPLPMLIGIGVALLWLSTELAMSYNSLTIRNRRLLSNLLALSWTLGVLFAVYREWMFCTACFFYLAMQAQFFLNNRGGRKKRKRLDYFVTLLCALTLAGLQWYVGLPH